jgi:hypothetical protein
MFSNFINPLAILISLSTTSGLLVHDTHIDSAAITALALPTVLASNDITTKLAGFGGEGHTHVERSSFSQTINALNSHIPGMQPRANEDKKHLMQKHVGRGHHAFDSYNLPIV